MRLRWHHGFLDPRDGEREVPRNRAAIAAAIGEVLPALAPVSVDRISFVRRDDGAIQVNLHMFGPFEILERDRPGD